ncbi:MAG: Maf family protein [Patescibacteria group bacterium]
MGLKKYKIILGSASKGRKAVLEKMGYDFEVLTADIDEKAIRDDNPQILTSKLANAKADALIKKINEVALLITADQVINYNGTIREKPETPQEAREFLKSYAKYPAEAINTIVVTDTSTGKRVEASDSKKVYFKSIPDNIIDKLIAEGNVFTQAGGFSTNDPLIKPYILKIQGEEDSVLGLPVKLTKKLLAKFDT